MRLKFFMLLAILFIAVSARAQTYVISYSDDTFTNGEVIRFTKDNPGAKSSYTGTVGQDGTHYKIVWCTSQNAWIIAVSQPENPDCGIGFPFWTSTLNTDNPPPLSTGGWTPSVYYASMITWSGPGLQTDGPSISAGALNAFSSCSGSPSASQSFTVSGSALTGNITVTAPAGFAIATTSGGTYGSSLTLTQSAGTVSTTLFARMASATASPAAGNIMLASTDATTQSIPVSGTVNAVPAVTVGTVAGVNTLSNTFFIPYTNAAGTPTKYTVTAGVRTLSGFTAVNNGTLGTTPIGVGIPVNSAAGTYDFNLTVSTASCTSVVYPFTLTITAPSLPANPLVLNGINQYASIPANPALEFSTGTVELWVRPDWVPGAPAGSPGMIAERGNGGTRYSFHISSNLDAVGLWNGVSFSPLPYNFVKGTWYHLAFVMGASTTQVYVNGVSIGTTTNTVNTPATGMPVNIGLPDISGTAEIFKGAIDEVRIWNTIRTQSQIQNSMGEPVPANSTGLIAYYPVAAGVTDETNRATKALADITSFNHSGTLYNYWSPAVTTAAASAITFTGATLGGNVTDDAGNAITERGVVYATTANPTTTDAKAVNSANTTGTFTQTITGLTSGTTYHVRAFATNSIGTAYGDDVTFTVASVPRITDFSPANGLVGTPVTITGTGFDATPGNNIVFFGATKAAVTVASTTSLTVTVPVGATYQPISVLNGTTGLVAYSAKPFITTFTPVKGIVTADDFTPKVDFNTGANVQTVTIGDLDSDGKADLVVANVGASTVSVYRNISASGSITSNSFAEKVDLPTQSSPMNVAIGDLDGDGKPDLAIASFNSTLSIIKNKYTGGPLTADSFEPFFNIFLTSRASSVLITDLDNDGRADITVGTLFGKVIVLRNVAAIGTLSTSSFQSAVDIPVGNNVNSIAIADLDGDGKQDIVTANANDNTLSVIKNLTNGNGIQSSSFATKLDLVSGSAPYGVAIGDIDGDGKPDIVAACNNSTGTISVIRNISTNGNLFTTASFKEKVDFTTGSYNTGVAIGDLNGDGKPDLAVSNYGNSLVYVFKNTAVNGDITATSFAAKTAFGGTNGLYNIAIGDLDGDGKADLAIPGYYSTSVSVLRYNPVYAPVTQATNVTFASTTATGTTISWTNGNGSGRAVFVKAASSGTPLPVDASIYIANTAFNTGSQIGSSGWYCVYKGAGSSVAVTGLTAGTTYQVMVAEYNGSLNNEMYQTATATGNPASVTPVGAVAPTVAATNLTFASTTDNSTVASWTNGNGTARAVFVRYEGNDTAAPVNNATYTPNGVYWHGTQIGTSGWYCAYTGTGSSATIGGLDENETYRVMVVEYNGTAGSEKYLATAGTGNPANIHTVSTDPTVAASGTPDALTTTFGIASATTSFIVSGTNLEAVVKIEAPTGFEVSTNETSGFANTIRIGSGATLAETRIYVRLSATAPVATYDSGNIYVDTDDGNFVAVPIPGSVVNPAVVSPAVLSIVRLNDNPSNASTLDFKVTFSKPVFNVDIYTFMLGLTGFARGTISTVTPVSTRVYTVTITGVNKDGTIRLDYISNGGVTDADDNPTVSDFTTGEVYTVDHTGPNTPVITALADGAHTIDTQPVFTGTAEANSTVKIYFDDSDSEAGSGITNAMGQWTITPTSPLLQGAHTFKIIAADALGNESDPTRASAFTIDGGGSAAPTVLSIVRADANPVINGSINYTVTFSEPVTGVTGASFVLSTTGTAGATVGNPTPISSSVYNMNVYDAFNDGTIRLDLIAANAVIKNAAGVALSADFTTGETYTIDSTPPAKPVIAGFPNSGAFNSNTPTFKGTAEPNSTVNIYIDNLAAPVASVTTNASGKWVYTPTTALPEGIHQMSATATDAAGNVSRFTGSSGLLIDTTIPAITISTTAGNPTSTSPIPVSLVLNDDYMVAFASTSLVVTNGTAQGFSGSGRNYTVNIVPTASGTVTVSVPENALLNVAGSTNPSAASLSIDYNAPATVSANADLTALASSAGTLSPAFDPAVTSYTLNIPNTVSSVKFTPTAGDNTASILLNEVAAVQSGTQSRAVGVDVGSTHVSIKVTAADGTTTKTYSITIVRPPSSDADLYDLAISGQNLDQVFAPATTSYTATVDNSVSSVMVTAITDHLRAKLKIRINGGDYATLTSETASSALPLNTGTNTIDVQVTAQDGTIKTYTVTVTRVPGSTTPVTPVSPAAVITFAGTAAKTYGDTDFEAGATSTNAAAAITYSSSNTAVATIISGKVHVVSAGTTTITASQAGDANYNAANDAMQTLTVNPKAITITADAQSKTYGDADPALTYKITAGTLLTGDTFTGKLSRIAGENAGSYTIAQGTLALSANYTLTYTSAKLTINAKAITITADTQTKTYGSKDPALTYQVTTGTLVNGDSFTGSLSRTTGENVGSYDINQGTLGLNSNYALTYNKDTFNITPASRSITMTNNVFNVTYGDSDFSPGAKAISGEAVPYSSSNTSVVTIVNGKVHIIGAGSATITATLPDNANYYPATPVSAGVFVDKAHQIITFAAIPSMQKKITGYAGTYDLSVIKSNSGLPVTVTSSDPLVAAINGGILTADRIGITTITATQPGNANYYPATISQVVAVNDVAEDKDIYVRQAVSPNGDGINDGLYIEGIEQHTNNSVIVINRNGVKVFEIKGYNNHDRTFDGHSNLNGKQLQQAGTYFYIAEYDGKRVTGWFVLKK